MKRLWRITPHDSARVERLAAEANLPDVVARLMVARGVYDAETARKFLNVKLSDLRDPESLPGVPEAVEVIWRAVEDQSPIVIYGDYDCDGMTGAAILVNGLKLMGADVGFHVPNRLQDGYGLNDDAIRKLAARGKKLIVTVDCGITSLRHAELCRELGVGLVVTDHHTIAQDGLPTADAVVHPRLPGSTYPFGELCGAGVAFKLAWALCRRAAGGPRVTDAMRTYLMRSLALTAIGTVADMVPLVDENRVLVHHGLKLLKKDPMPGLAELMAVTGADKNETFNAEVISFNIAPRLNASGRLGQAQLGVELMTLGGGERAKSLATYINELNSSRESLQRSVYLAAQKQAKSDFDPEGDAALVLAGVGWHAGMIGVVAGRLAERYAKPVIVLALDASGRGSATGSGRVGGTDINLYDAIAECEHHLERFGGHAAAAGVTIQENRIDAFRADFVDAIARQWTEREVTPEIRIDAETPLSSLNIGALKQIEMMAPFGSGNPRPVLCCGGIRCAEPAEPMGAAGRHMSVRLTDGVNTVRAVAFNAAGWIDELNAAIEPFEIVYKPQINEWNGRRTVELQLVDWRLPSDAEVAEVAATADVGVSTAS